MNKCLCHNFGSFLLAYNSINPFTLSYEWTWLATSLQFHASVSSEFLAKGDSFPCLTLSQSSSLYQNSHLLFPAPANRPSAFYWQMMIPHSTQESLSTTQTINCLMLWIKLAISRDRSYQLQSVVLNPNWYIHPCRGDKCVFIHPWPK